MTEIVHNLLVIRKMLLSLETKLARLENANGNLIEAFEQNNDKEDTEQFQYNLLGSIVVLTIEGSQRIVTA